MASKSKSDKKDSGKSKPVAKTTTKKKATPAAGGKAAKPAKVAVTVKPKAAKDPAPASKSAPTRRGDGRAARTIDLTHDMIAGRAYQLWQASGCAPGRDAENWRQAEAELKAEYGIA